MCRLSTRPLLPVTGRHPPVRRQQLLVCRQQHHAAQDVGGPHEHGRHCDDTYGATAVPGECLRAECDVHRCMLAALSLAPANQRARGRQGGYRCINGEATRCSAGYWATGGQRKCSLCDADTYSAAGASECTPCGTGKTSAPGSAECLFKCPPGFTLADAVTDSDNDGTVDCLDACPHDNTTTVGTDVDHDNVPDCVDTCIPFSATEVVFDGSPMVEGTGRELTIHVGDVQPCATIRLRVAVTSVVSGTNSTVLVASDNELTAPTGSGVVTVQLTAPRDFTQREHELQRVMVSLVSDEYANGTLVELLAADVAVIDVDHAAVVVSSSPAFVADPDLKLALEEGRSASYYVVLTSKPESAVTVTPVATDSRGLLQVPSPSSVTFKPESWNEPQTIKVTAVDDKRPPLAGVPPSIVIKHEVRTGDAVYASASLPVAVVDVTIDDNDVVGISVGQDIVSLVPWDGASRTGYVVACVTQRGGVPCVLTVRSGGCLQVRRRTHGIGARVWVECPASPFCDSHSVIWAAGWTGGAELPSEPDSVRPGPVARVPGCDDHGRSSPGRRRCMRRRRQRTLGLSHGKRG